MARNKKDSTPARSPVLSQTNSGIQLGQPLGQVTGDGTSEKAESSAERIIPKASRKPVVSSNIAAIGYYPQLSILEVEFRNGSVYHYFDVPEYIYEEFIAAPSHGGYHGGYIMFRYRYACVKERDYLGRRTTGRARRESAESISNLFRLFACDWCYDVLGVSRTDGVEAIRRAYHKKAHLYHPDKGGDEQAMKRLNEAFALVKKAVGRK